ncbi:MULTISPECIES: class I SAM-dependent methyltransferase [Streptomyces]|uniref:class I SAM-dependent methyltransferase n=1 Tax=Streptomyces TaxID=1883 RepID=UPI000B08CD11|nr:class I SAM-dependent methyltransferase [Streptomyces sp. EN16]
MDREKPRLGRVQETRLIPLYARAVENRKEHALLRDTRAEEIVAAIDYDFGRFDELPGLTGSLLHAVRTRRQRPRPLVRTRSARVIGLREKFFTDSPRRTMIAASVTEETWTAEVAPHSSEPYLFVAEAVLPYLHEPEVRQAFGLLADRFPGSLLALDTAGPGFLDTQEQHDALSKVEARMRWYCPDPADLTDWHPGTEVVASHTLTSLPDPLLAELPAAHQQMMSALAEQRLPQAEDHRLSLLRLP